MHLCAVQIYYAVCGVLKRELKLEVCESRFDLQRRGSFGRGWFGLDTRSTSYWAARVQFACKTVRRCVGQ